MTAPSISVCASHVLGFLDKARLPQFALTPMIRAYVRWFAVDMSQVAIPEGGFDTFGSFFARRLQPNSRHICGDPGSLVCPCDGLIVDLGDIDADDATTLVIKGVTYRLGELIGDEQTAAELAGGGYCVIYLHPRDYHRVHVPVSSVLTRVQHLPGTRLPVAPWAAEFNKDVLRRNERLAFHLEWSSNGDRLVLLMVSAFGVGGIESETVGMEPAGRRTIQDATAGTFRRRGDEIGAFRLGSTVALLWPKGAVILDESVQVGGRVCVGQRIGRLRARERTAPLVG